MIYPADPQLAPGFNYTLLTPPLDGTYTLTNDMTKWPSVWSTWLQIGDNSDDPGGYMMVVNASETPGIFYEQLIDNICENTVYEFSADAINLMRMNMGGILPDISFYINDVLLYTTGPVAQDETWHTYGFTFTTSAGQSMLKLTLRNNAPGGGGNDLALDNIVFRACGPETDIKLQPGEKFCENELPKLAAQIDADTGYVQWQMSTDSLQWNDVVNGTTRIHQVKDLAPGKYYFRFLYGNTPSNLTNSRCRVISATVSFEVLPAFYTASAIVCEGLGFAFGDSIYYEAGFYQHAFPRNNQCDSVVTLELLLFPDPPIITDYEIIPPSCKGAADGGVMFLSVSGMETPASYVFNDVEVAVDTVLTVPAGVHTALVTNEYGCFDLQELMVPEGPLLQVMTIQDTSLLYGKRLLLTTSTNMPASTFRWTPGVNMNCATCSSTEVIAKEDITYVVEAKTESGCVATDTVTIGISHMPVRFVPNVFTPNNDQVNDVFEITIEPVSFLSIDRIVILDRWGNVLNQQSNLLPADRVQVWDGGTTHGPASPGVYFYSIDLTLIDGAKEHLRGDVTVIN